MDVQNTNLQRLVFLYQLKQAQGSNKVLDSIRDAHFLIQWIFNAYCKENKESN